METFFDHNPTDEEIEQITSCKTKEEYLKRPLFPEGNNFLDIALLYKRRGDKKNFEKYRKKAPKLYQQYKWGLDYITIPTED